VLEKERLTSLGTSLPGRDGQGDASHAREGDGVVHEGGADL
jgi:hypothetical protein